MKYLLCLLLLLTGNGFAQNLQLGHSSPHKSSVFRLCMAPGYVVSCDSDGLEIVVWSLPGREMLYRLKPDSKVTDLALADGRIVAACHGERLQAWSLQDGRLLWNVTSNRTSAKRLGGYQLGVGPAGRYAFTTGGYNDSYENSGSYDMDSDMQIYDLSSGQCVHTFSLTEEARRSGRAVQAWLASDRLLLTDTTGVGVASPPEWKPLRAATGDLSYAAVSPQRNLVAIAWKRPSIDLLSASELGGQNDLIPRTVTGPSRGLVRFISEHWLYAQSLVGDHSLIDVDKAVVAKTFPKRSYLEESHPASDRFLMSSNQGLEVWQGSQRLCALALPGQIGRFSPDGRYLLSYEPGRSSTVKLWDCATGSQLSTGGTFCVIRLAWSEDGQWVVAADDTGALKLWEVVDGKLK